MTNRADFENQVKELLKGVHDKREEEVDGEKIVQSFTESLNNLLENRGSSDRLINCLKENTVEGGLIDPSKGNDIEIWLWCYHFLLSEEDKFRTADHLIETCYNRLLQLQREHDTRYHKGAPLHERGWGWNHIDFTKAKRFFLLAHIEDLISGQKKAPAYQTLRNAGVTDADLELVEVVTKEVIEEKGNPRFPEEIYQRVKSEIEVKSLGEFERDIVFTNTEYLAKLLDGVERAMEEGDEDAKGKTLERLAQYLFSSIEGFEFDSERTDYYQLDGVITNTSRHTFLETLDNFVLVECKNWQEPIGVPVVNEFLGKLDMYQCDTGILLSKEGVKDTTEEPRRDAFRRTNTAILLLDKDDIESIINKDETIVSLLFDEFKRLKFSM